MSNKIFKTPFSKVYWVSAASEFKSLRTIVLAAVFVALQIAMTSLYIPVPSLGTQKVFFSFLVVSLGSLIYGPLVGICTGFAGDILGYLIHPQGAFFFGYTITSMLSGFVYGIFLYKTKISITKLIVCKFFVNMLINVCINAYWDSILIGKGYLVLLVSRVPKNLIMLPIEILLMFLVFKILIPIMKREKIINYAPYEKKMPWF